METNKSFAPDFVINLLRVTNSEDDQVRTVHHFHYLSWPDHGVPAVCIVNLTHKDFTF
jgi:protein tyrosine phosphatase